MPGKNVVKTYVEGGYYHVYNRGVEKRKIFEDEKDYKVFLSYLKSSLSPPPDPKTLIKTLTFKGPTFKGVPRQPKNYSQEIDLLAYCLMPNHFHLLIRQKAVESMEGFVRSLATRYSMYFNKKSSRVGPLFQGNYKAALISEEPYLLHLSRYIHLNPSEYTPSLTEAYSSYADYLGIRKTPWVNPEEILSLFNQPVSPVLKKVNTYQEFVERLKEDSKEILGELTLEDS